MLKDMFTSKKFVVFFTMVAVAALSTFGGIEEAQAKELISNITPIAMAYLGAQGLADFGKHGKKKE
jgi:hypothetical protein